MTSFNVEFFDQMAYLLPGNIILLGLLMTRRSLITHIENGKHIVHYVVIAFVLSFGFGFLTHLAGTTMQGVVDRLVGTRSLQRLLDKTPEIDIAEKQALKKIEINFPDRMAFYRYAETIVETHMPARAARASRLQALALFSRNTIMSLVFFFIVAILSNNEVSCKFRLICMFCMPIILLLLWHGYIIFSKNSIYVTLRAFSIWCE